MAVVAVRERLRITTAGRVVPAVVPVRERLPVLPVQERQDKGSAVALLFRLPQLGCVLVVAAVVRVKSVLTVRLLSVAMVATVLQVL